MESKDEGRIVVGCTEQPTIMHIMEYKRKESFRYKLINPIDLACMVKHPDRETAIRAEGTIIDISPRGLRVGFEKMLPTDVDECTLLLNFVIYERTFEIAGETVWDRPDGEGLYTYGVRLNIDDRMQESIIEDLKLRRKAEVAGGKGKKKS